VVQFAFRWEVHTINVLQKIMAVHCENHTENNTTVPGKFRVLILVRYFKTLSAASFQC
jgi:hypothetical protein